MANLLVHESSPYLLQHANNPVNWRAWNDETLALAKSQQKLILVSIGYSACHWCHVMEKQCFENEEAARIMNKYFICIKVDREERPDIDAIYMQALQLMSGQGGWPLNCFTLPDGRPIYGGTYFPLEKWMAILENLQELFETNLSSMEDYATRLLNGIKQTQIYKVPAVKALDFKEILGQSVANWKKHFDLTDGGTQRVPKFPMPCNYLFLLNYGLCYQISDILSHVFLTLDKMSMGGLFDQLGGGFARYSTDGIWKVPHFEKMLYDNAQLVSLYSKAYKHSGNKDYKAVVEKTLMFIEKEMTGELGEFYSALDADSEGEEGKYYVWNKKELEEHLGEDYKLFEKYYNINEIGYWEHDNYILYRVKTDTDFCKEYQITASELEQLHIKWQASLLAKRSYRTLPGLDDKILTSWNALMLKGYIDAYLAIANESYLEKALKTAHFIVNELFFDQKFLFHSYKKNKATINGFLEDYAFVAESFVSLYEVTGNEIWLVKAKQITDSAIENFYDVNDGLFFFNSVKDTPLIARQKEVQDNVIPSSNAVMANVLFHLGNYFEEDHYLEKSKKMVAYFYDEIKQYGSAYACWANLLMRFASPVVQVAIPAKDYQDTILKIQKAKYANLFLFKIHHQATLPFIKDKLDKENFYYCIDKVCSLPLNNQIELITAFEKL
jgi:hypothetical protein